MDDNTERNSPQEPVQESASYTRPSNSSSNFFDKFSSFFTKKTIAVLVILVLIIGVGAATIAVQRSTEIRQRAASVLCGDVNGDGVIDAKDDLLIKQSIAGLLTLTPAQIAAADVNGDGVIDAKDDLLILQYIAGLISTFPGGCPSGSVISGTVFLDNNGNGVQDSGETDYPGNATITLEDDTHATQAYGTGYYFTHVASGSHNVTLTVPPGYTETTPIKVSVTVPPSPGTFHFGIKSTSVVIPTPTTPPGVTAAPTPTTPPGVTAAPTPTTPPGVTAAPTVTPSPSVLCGDVNGDGVIDPRDSSLILQYAAGLITFTPAQIAAADVNGDGVIDPRDSSLILQYAAGTISTFPGGCPSGSVISGTVFLDNNGNGVQDSGETDYPGNATITLEDGTHATQAFFGGINGYYFTHVASGSHNVTLTVPPGYTETTPIKVSVTVPPSPGTFHFGIKSGAGGGTQFALTIGLDGLGTTGDNATPNDSSGSNKSPKRPTRNVKVEVFDGNGNSVANKSGTLAYQTGSGKFTGNIDMGTLASGNYTVKVKSDGYLRRLIPGIQNVTAGQPYNVSAVNLVTGDINGDNAINILDYNILISCFSDPTQTVDSHALCNSNAQYAVLSDLEDNGVVNQFDYNLILREFSVQNGD